MEPAQVAFYLVGVVIIIIGAYYATYYIGLKASGQSRGRLKNRNINVIDRFSFSRDKSFCIVEIAGKIYVIGITNQSMTLLDTLDASEFPQAAAERHANFAWPAASSNSITGKMTKRLAAFMAARMGRPFEDSAASGGDFAESMKTAAENNRPGQPGRVRAERTGDPEGEE